jgi:hypothetical protein
MVKLYRPAAAAASGLRQNAGFRGQDANPATWFEFNDCRMTDIKAAYNSGIAGSPP